MHTVCSVFLTPLINPHPRQRARRLLVGVALQMVGDPSGTQRQLFGAAASARLCFLSVPRSS